MKFKKGFLFSILMTYVFGFGVVEGDGGGDGDGENDEDDSSQSGKKGKKDETKTEDQKQSNPTDSEAKLLKEVMQRKAKESELKAELEKLRGELGKFDGIDIAEVIAMIEAKTLAEQKELEQKGQWETLKAQMANAHTAELSALKEQMRHLEEGIKNKNLVIDRLSLGNAFDSSQFIKENLILPSSKARILYENYFDVVDGEVVGYDKPRGYEGRSPMVDARGENLPFESAIQKVIDLDPDKNAVLRSKKLSGAASSTQTDVKSSKREDDSEFGESRIASALAKGVLSVKK